MSNSYRDLVGALRTSTVEPADAGEATRARILRDLARAKPQRRTRTRRVLALIAASIAMSSAFALYVNTGSPHEPRRPAGLRENARAALSAEPARPSARPVRFDETRQEDKQEEAPRVRPATQLRQTGPQARPKAHGAAEPAPPPFPPAVHAQTAPTTSEAERKALYISAHRLQFRGAPERALQAWDAYLATQPAGPVLREAQYNRAVILVRLGRRTEAERALLPFARGEHAGFRQGEARELLRSLPPPGVISAD